MYQDVGAKFNINEYFSALQSRTNSWQLAWQRSRLRGRKTKWVCRPVPVGMCSEPVKNSSPKYIGR
jgi:hypothetical protein